MNIRGWVYAIWNPTFPDLVKIGYSTKDPRVRARELSGTGVPHPSSVVFDALVSDPRRVEALVHKRLAGSLERKEWYRVTKDQAIEAIRQEASAFTSEITHLHASDASEAPRLPPVPQELHKASEALAAIVGNEPLSRPEVTKRVWVYIKRHGLQDEKAKTIIRADAKLLPIFEKDAVSMFEMTKQISKHLTPYV